MSEHHEIKVFNIRKDELIDTIYIHDDFFGYLGEKYRSLSELMDNIPVFYPTSSEYPFHLDEFQERKPTKRGISLWGINILNSSTFEKLLHITNGLKDSAENLDDEILNKFDYSFTKEETIYNLKKLSTILENISLNKNEYILVWEGI